MEGCRSLEALTQFGLAFFFQMLMFVEVLTMHQGHTQGKWQKAQTSLLLHIPQVSQGQREWL